MSAVPHTPRFKAFIDKVSARIDDHTGEVPGWVKRVANAATGAGRESLVKQAADLRKRQPPLRAAAIAKGVDRDRFLATSAHILAERDWLGYANFIAQIGIALASVAALLKERRMFFAGAGAGVISIVMVIYAYAMHLGIVG